MVDRCNGSIERVHLGEAQPQKQALVRSEPAAHSLDHLGVGGPDLGPDQAGKALGSLSPAVSGLKKNPCPL